MCTLKTSYRKISDYYDQNIQKPNRDDMLDIEFKISISVDIEKIRSKRFEKSYKNVT